MNVRAGLEGTVEITLPAITDFQQTMTVTAPEFRAPEAVKNSGFLVAPREILKSAAALQDVSRYVQGLPGVVIGTNDFRNDIIVRGGSPLENLFVVDNVEIPNINAFANFASAGGTVSLLDAELLQDVTFLTGGYPAPFINRTSSVLQVTQREGNRQQFGGWATLGFAGAGAIFEGPIGAGKDGGKGSWVVSARRSFLDLFTDDVGFGGVPVLYTLNAKAVYDLTSRDRIWLVNIAGVDEIRLGLSESTDIEEEIANFDIRYDGWRSATGFNWQRTFGSRGVGLFGLSHSQAKVGQQVKDLVAQGVPPPGVPPDVVIAQSPVVYFEDSREAETTLKYDLTLHLPFFDTVQAGGSFKRFRIDYTVDSPYGNDTPYSPVAGIDPFSLDTSFDSYQTGAYLQASKQVASRVNLTLGGRFDHYAILSKARFSPRAGINVRLADTLSWNSSAGSVPSAAGVPLRDRVSAERVARALARRPLRDGPGVVAGPVPADDGGGVSENVQRLPGCRKSAQRVAGKHRRHLRCARDPVSAHERRRGLLARCRSVRREAAHREALWSGQRVVLADAACRPRPRAPRRIVRLPIRVERGRRLSVVICVGTLRPAFVPLGPPVHAI